MDNTFSRIASARVRTQFYGHQNDVYKVTLHEPPVDLSAVPEALVQDLWQYQDFALGSLHTTDGTPVRVIEAGTPNADSGPDFRNAHICIGSTEWHGDVEIHVTSRGWFDHGHQRDSRYNSVVLHVTLCSDLWTGGLLREDGSHLPELLLRPHLKAPLRRLLYQFRTSERGALPCASWWGQVPRAKKDQLIDSLADERMRTKAQQLADRFLSTPSLEALLHEHLFAGLGYAKNTDPMTDLARRLPLHLLRQIDHPVDIEALHLGVAGLLPAPADLLETDRATADYVMDLRHRFERLQVHHDLSLMERTQWRFFRLRPANFPPLRIAQAAALTAPGGLLRHHPIDRLLDGLQQRHPLEALRELFEVELSPFWTTHVRLTASTKPRSAAIGRTRRQTLIANTLVPTSLLHADQTQDEGLRTAAMDLLKALPAERNHILRRFSELGTKTHTAYRSQGLLHLYKTRCTRSRCLSCPVGRFLVDGRGE